MVLFACIGIALTVVVFVRVAIYLTRWFWHTACWWWFYVRGRRSVGAPVHVRSNLRVSLLNGWEMAWGGVTGMGMVGGWWNGGTDFDWDSEEKLAETRERMRLRFEEGLSPGEAIREASQRHSSQPDI